MRPLTNTELRAAAVPVSGAVTATPPTVALATLSSTCTALGSNVILANPVAGSRYRIHALQLLLGIAGAQTIIVESDATELWNFVGSALGAGLVKDFAPGRELTGVTGKGISFDLSAATLVRYVIQYTTEVAP